MTGSSIPQVPGMVFERIQCGRAHLYRCPHCKSVATFGRYPEIPENKIPERWLCKWCGWWWNKDIGVLMCCVNAVSGHWEARKQAARPMPTPMQRYAMGLDTAPYLQLWTAV